MILPSSLGREAAWGGDDPLGWWKGKAAERPSTMLRMVPLPIAFGDREDRKLLPIAFGNREDK